MRKIFSLVVNSKNSNQEDCGDDDDDIEKVYISYWKISRSLIFQVVVDKGFILVGF